MKEKKPIPFMKVTPLAIVLSLLIILAGVVVYVVNGGFEVGIDFKGGSRAEVALQQKVSVGEIRSLFKNVGIDANVTTVGLVEDNRFVITVPYEEGRDGIELIKKTLYQAYGEDKVSLLGVTVVEAKVGKSFVYRALNLIWVVSLIILVYIVIRFDFSYGFGAVVALLHDLLIMLAFALFLRIPIDITIIAAILMILGYSINDTIVVFDRIRERKALHKEEDFVLVIDRSVTEVLDRSIITSLTTLFAAVALYIWGGEVLRNFSVILIVGLISGTYSSVMIASPVTAGVRRLTNRAK
ncbi:protein translocase subunit SecF [Thermospira aquatica]|uniref:Protein-export membrane protein SecF n=1 Tax=Thermospira aquatica TaxID=2828656 RepID=A0AAX3BCW6_9SPIR|nr:protein translocase subunit SecF [Thermospira aquatica]URA10154.1 protein translocase subunit SecF [Thermospira aquatica]